MTRTRWIFILLLLFGIMGVATTYTQLSQTADESYHISCGMEWWQKGTYTMEPKHAPLERIMESALPYWLNAEKAAQTMSPRDSYIYNIMLARLGVLPLYIFSCVLVFLWSRKLFDEEAALWSLALYVTLSTVSAHAGLATTDMGCAAMSLWAMMAGADWLKKPARSTGLLLGASLGLAIATKFSVLVHWPAAMVLIIVAQAWANRRLPIRLEHIKTALLYALPALILAVGLVYRFSFGAVFQGIHDLQTQNRDGYALWLFGQLHNHGLWYFFPVVFFFKTPLPFHIAGLIGNVKILCEGKRRHRILANVCQDPVLLLRSPQDTTIERLFPLLMAFGVLLPSMTSNINLGVRHVLTLYPLLAIPAGYGLYWLWQSNGWKRLLAVGLLCWQLAGFIAGWPDHIRYFNELGGEHPEHISLDCDFDWGQNLIMLDKALQRYHADGYNTDAVYMCVRPLSVNKYFNDERMLLHSEPLQCPKAPITGWLAVSRTEKMWNPVKFTWLNVYEPVQRIGTLDLYYILHK